MNVSEMLGKTLVNVYGSVGEDVMTFVTNNGERYCLYHEQDCCESVSIEDITGDLNDLIGYPLTMSEEVTNEPEPKRILHDSYTWTFYKFATIKGYVTVRWLGESNGYYSEGVDFKKM